MRAYELMMISRGDLDEAAVNANIERFKTLITDQGGSVDGIDHWGKRAFAYEINHMKDGYYTVIDLQLPSEGLTELDRQLRIADEVVRHKIIRPAIREKRER